MAIRRILLSLFSILASAAVAAELPEPSAAKLPRWRGFNLVEHFNAGNASAFREEDFRLIAELGFNFVRLPMDYRIWIKEKDWRQLDDSKLVAVDQAVEFGRKHSVHVCLNFHRAPGHTVAQPPEAKSIWKDDEALAVCAMHWAHFAKRYKGIPNRNLSFDLMNEPPDIEPATHARVVKALVEAIRKEDAARLVIADGRAYGVKPGTELAGLGIAQMTRGYAPFHLTHYEAEWANEGHFPMPEWPAAKANGTLFGPDKKELKRPFVIEGDFPAGSLRVRVATVSGNDTLVIKGDGAVLWERVFAPRSDADCKRVDQSKSWPYGMYDRDYSVPLRAGVKRIELDVARGDWIAVSELGVTPTGGRETRLGLVPEWSKPYGSLRFVAGKFATETMQDRDYLVREMIEPWKALEKSGVGVMVGEWGAYNKTPHDVTLRWMEDCLRNWQEAGWGWALWNFRGPFGVLDSGRADVTYENFHGHKLDRAMLELLRKF